VNTNREVATFDRDGDLVIPRRRSYASTPPMLRLHLASASTANKSGLQIWRAAFLMAEFALGNKVYINNYT